MKAYKGFNEHLQCDPTGMKPFQYEIGGDYEENSAMVCRNGFHACENPMDVFSYYAPGKSRYCEVEIDNISKGHDGDTKVAGTKIHIGMEIGIKGIIKGALNFIFERVQKSNDTAATTGDDAHAATTGNRAHAAVYGKNSIAAALGINSKAKGAIGSFIVCSEWRKVGFSEWELVDVRSAKVDGTVILPDVFYILKNGEFVRSEDGDID